MRRNHALFALVAAGLLAAGCSAGGSDIAADGDREEITVDGQFSAELPGTPDDTDVDGSAGRVYSVKDGDLEVGIIATELPGADVLPPDNVAGLLTQINETTATAVGGTVVSSEPVSDLAYAAQDAEFTTVRNDTELVGLTRAVLAGDRQFQLMAIGAVDDRAEVEAIFERLVDGFEPAIAA
jgi:hypothetical protein